MFTEKSAYCCSEKKSEEENKSEIKRKEKETKLQKTQSEEFRILKIIASLCFSLHRGTGIGN